MLEHQALCSPGPSHLSAADAPLRPAGSNSDESAGSCVDAGYGKTTLVSSWLVENKCPVGWLSLDESDNNPVRFLQYLTRGLAPILPAMDIQSPGMRQELPSDTLLNPILNATAQ